MLWDPWQRFTRCVIIVETLTVRHELQCVTAEVGSISAGVPDPEAKWVPELTVIVCG